MAQKSNLCLENVHTSGLIRNWETHNTNLMKWNSTIEVHLLRKLIRHWLWIQRTALFETSEFFSYLSFIIWSTVVLWKGMRRRTSWTPPSSKLTLESIYPIKLGWPFRFDWNEREARISIKISPVQHWLVHTSSYLVSHEKIICWPFCFG